jgi:DNA-binding transcriptional MerR regulator
MFLWSAVLKLNEVFPVCSMGLVRFGAGMKQSFTSRQVSRRTGLTPRQLQWWDEQGIVTPVREGHRRLYSAEDLAELSLLSHLRRRGFSLQRIRRMVGLLRREFGRRLADLLGRGRDLHLLTDGESVFLCDSERGVIDLLRNTQQPLLAICLGPLLERALAPELEPAEETAVTGPVQPKRVQPKRAETTIQQGAPFLPSPGRSGEVAPKKSSQSAKARPSAPSISRRRWR